MKIETMPKTTFTICVDLDGVLAQPCRGEYEGIKDPVRGAQKFVARLQGLGRVLLHSCRTNKKVHHDAEKQIVEISRWLDRHDFPAGVLIYVGDGKPVARAYIDDRAVACRPMEKDDGEFFPEFAYDDAVFETEKLLGLIPADE